MRTLAESYNFDEDYLDFRHCMHNLHLSLYKLEMTRLHLTQVLEQEHKSLILSSRNTSSSISGGSHFVIILPSKSKSSLSWVWRQVIQDRNAMAEFLINSIFDWNQIKVHLLSIFEELSATFWLFGKQGLNLLPYFFWNIKDTIIIISSHYFHKIV